MSASAGAFLPRKRAGEWSNGIKAERDVPDGLPCPQSNRGGHQGSEDWEEAWMVIREDLERENEPAAVREESTPGRSPQRPGTATATPAAAPPMQGFQKCPYLAGRPPCGTHHMFPSGT